MQLLCEMDQYWYHSDWSIGALHCWMTLSLLWLHHTLSEILDTVWIALCCNVDLWYDSNGSYWLKYFWLVPSLSHDIAWQAQQTFYFRWNGDFGILNCHFVTFYQVIVYYKLFRDESFDFIEWTELHQCVGDLMDYLSLMMEVVEDSDI